MNKKINNVLNSKFKYAMTYTIFYWIISILITYREFNLGISSIFQVVINVLSPFVLYGIFIGIAFFSKSNKTFRRNIWLINLIFIVLLVSNVYYYREFTDFLTVDTIIKSGAVMGGMTGSTTRMFELRDIFYVLPILFFGLYNIRNKKLEYKETKFNKFELGTMATSLGVLISAMVLTLAEIDRPELLTRGFDNKYIVKYLGIPSFLTKSGVQTYEIQQKRASASESGLNEVIEYTKTRETTPNEEYFGKLRGKNVVYIHLESFQQFLINYKITGEDGKEYEVTPNLNKIFNSQDTLAYDNYYHQVSQGKTSDAELLIDNSYFGSKQGSSMVKYGSDNTFYSMPNVLKNLGGYNSAVFHGNNASFWNRNNAYKGFGYDKFYSLEHFNNQNVYGYGLRDEDFFPEAYEKYEKLESPKYTKFIPVSHHFPYKYDMFETEFPNVKTSDETINGYFITANYMDKQIGNFIDKFSDEEKKNTVFVLYGDHYGISNSRNKVLGEFMYEQDKLKGNDVNDSFSWDNYNNAMMQRVPLMFYSEGSNIGKNGINHTIGGQVDTMPTLLSLLGYKDTGLILMGQDITSKDSQNYVVFRNGDVISEKYTLLGDKVYDTKTGNLLDEYNEDEVSNLKEQGKLQLLNSDKVMDENLLSLYINQNIDRVDKSKLNYKK